jgi:WD40 repeat protein
LPERGIAAIPIADPPLAFSVSVGGKPETKSAARLRPLWRLGPIPADKIARGLEMSRDGSQVAVALGDKAYLWKFKPGPGPLKFEHSRWCEARKEGNPGPTSFRTVRFSPDGSLLVAAGDDGTARVFNEAALEETYLLGGNQGKVLDAVILPDGKMIMLVDEHGSLNRWNMSTRKAAGELPMGNDAPESFALSPRNDRLAMVGKSGIDLCGIQAATVTRLGALKFPLKETSHTVASFTPDGKTLVSGTSKGTVVFWDVETRALRRSFQAISNGRVRYLACLGNGEVLATMGTSDAALWDAALGTRLATFTGQKGYVRFLAASADGRRLATLGRQDRSITVWEFERN